jgi:hypothetical protein
MSPTARGRPGGSRTKEVLQRSPANYKGLLTRAVISNSGACRALLPGLACPYAETADVHPQDAHVTSRGAIHLVHHFRGWNDPVAAVTQPSVPPTSKEAIRSRDGQVTVVEPSAHQLLDIFYAGHRGVRRSYGYGGMCLYRAGRLNAIWSIDTARRLRGEGDCVVLQGSRRMGLA